MAYHLGGLGVALGSGGREIGALGGVFAAIITAVIAVTFLLKLGQTPGVSPEMNPGQDQPRLTKPYRQRARITPTTTPERG